MNGTYKYRLFLGLALIAMLTACDKDELPKPAQDVVVAVNTSRAEGTNDGEYWLMFWFGTKEETDAISTLNAPWFHSLKGTEANGTPVAGDVDYYKYEGNNDYPVTKDNGTQIMYPADDSPIHAVGYYPALSLTQSEDKKTLTLKTENIPGLVDVCSTEIESGTESKPFTSNKENELQFRHTQVKLKFRYKRTLNLNARIAEIWVTIPTKHIANKWTLTSHQGYVAESTTESTNTNIVFSSTEDWYDEIGDNFYTMTYTTFSAEHPREYKTTTHEDCYVLPNTGLFMDENRQLNIAIDKQAYIEFELNAVIISSDKNVPNKRVSTTVKIPLKDSNNKNWFGAVEAGDAFTIDIIFEQNRFVLMAYKMPWEIGGYLTIPLNPDNATVVSN